MSRTNLNVDELLTTTRAVRKRLDLSKPVPTELINECIEIALQAPSGGNAQNWQFVVVCDAAKRSAIAELYNKAWARYRKSPGSVFDATQTATDDTRRAALARVCESADYLAEYLHQVPVLVIPCVPGRVNKLTGDFASVGLASVYGSVLPATWSYMLAARSRGLGTCWTTAHLMHEHEAAEILGIPYDTHTQVALIPTAWYLGDAFKKASRKAVNEVIHIDKW